MLRLVIVCLTTRSTRHLWPEIHDIAQQMAGKKPVMAKLCIFCHPLARGVRIFLSVIIR